MLQQFFKQSLAPLGSSSFPFSGRVVPELGDESIREWFAYSYRIIYRVEQEIVTIAAVIHGRRLLDME
jgi:plasmid stabilization system protein ParE